MDNPASTEEETYTEEGATATPPGNTIPHHQAPHSPFPYSGMTVPYDEGPKMDWTVDDALHSRFIRWRIKCENILTGQIAILQENAKCKQVIQWSGDAGLDMYISWNLPKEEITLQTIWSRFEDFCKPQSNAVCARFNLLTTFRQGNRSIDKWYDAVLAHIPLCEYPKETAAILTRDIFWFFIANNEFIAKNINEGNTDPEQYPAAKVQQMAKKLESSKATAKYIKQHTSSMQGATEVNVLRHNHTSLPPKKKKGSKKPNPSTRTKLQQPLQHKQVNQHQSLPYAKNTNQCTRCGDSPHAQGFNCLAKKYQCKHCTKIGHFTKMCFTKSAHPQLQQYHRGKPKQAHQIVVPEHYNKCDNDDKFMIAFQLCAQPQRSIHNQRVNTSYAQKCLYANIPY